MGDLAHSQGHRGNHRSVLSSLTKPGESKHILKNRPILQYKTWVEIFWTSCAPHEDKKGCESHGWGDSSDPGSEPAIGQLLTHQVWPLLINPVRCGGFFHLPSHAHTLAHEAPWSYWAPTAQHQDAWLEGRAWLCPLSLWRRHGPGWRRSWGQQLQPRAVQTHRDVLLGHCLTPMHDMEEA